MIKELKKQMLKGIRRYFATAFFVVLLFFYSVYFYKRISEIHFTDLELWQSIRVLLALFFSGVTSLLVHLLLGDEANPSFAKKLRFFLALLLSTAAIFFYFWSMDAGYEESDLLYARWATYLITVAVLFVSLPFYKRHGLGMHLLYAVGNIGVALLISTVLFAGLCFIAFSLNSLFDLDRYRLWINEYEILFLFSYILVFPLCYLGIYPEVPFRRTSFFASRSAALSPKTMFSELVSASMDAASPDASASSDTALESASDRTPRILGEDGEPSFIPRVLLFYVVIPLLMVYTVVLYFYFVKLALALSFPNNVLAHLVIWFLSVSHISIYLLSGISRYRNEFEHWIIHSSHKYLPALLLPVGMMLTGIYIRISAYGFTEARYLLLMFALFHIIGLTLLYFFKWRAQFSIAVLAIAMLHLMFYGYFSVDQVTYRSQLAILKQNLSAQGADYDALIRGDVTFDDFPDLNISAEMGSGADKLLSMRQYDKQSAEFQVLDHIVSKTELYPWRYRAAAYASEDEDEPIFVENYRNVFELSEGEHLFRIMTGDRITVADRFFVVANEDHVSVYAKSASDATASESEIPEADVSDRKPLLVFEVGEILDTGAETSVYRKILDWEGTKYEWIFAVENFSYYVDEDGEISPDYAGYYVFYVLMRAINTLR